MALKAMVIVGVLVAAMACYTYAIPSPGEYEVVEAVPVAEERGDLGWQAPVVQQSGWGWKPKVKYLKFAIPIPQLPRIRFGIKGGLRLHASVQNGWGWKR